MTRMLKTSTIDHDDGDAGNDEADGEVGATEQDHVAHTGIRADVLTDDGADAVRSRC